MGVGVVESFSCPMPAVTGARRLRLLSVNRREQFRDKGVTGRTPQVLVESAGP